MDSIKYIVFRNLTDADFFNINKPPGSEQRGGGQAYIDFPVSSITIDQWQDFFANVKGVSKTQATKGPKWEFPVYSIGLDAPGKPVQTLTVYQRRAASVNIASQKVHSRRANRVRAWHPDHNFPKPLDNTDRHQCPDGLMVYLAVTYSGEVWAGWYLNDGTSPVPVTGADTAAFDTMFTPGLAKEGYSGMLKFAEGDLMLAHSDVLTPFKGTGKAAAAPLQPEHMDVDDEADVSEKLFDEDCDAQNPQVQERVVKIRKRNAKIVKKLKELYNHQCQVTGAEYTFQMKNGVNYTEAHHLVPLGAGGSDDPRNLVILSPLVHKMFHYADVSQIDLNDLVFDENGGASLELELGKDRHVIRWHPKHAELFE